MKSLLIIEDDGDFREIVADAFRKEGFETLCAGDGKSGLDICRRSPSNVVLLDLKLPDVKDLEALDEIKRISPAVPVIIMTGYGDIQTAVKTMKRGAYDFVVKPPDFEELITTVKEAADAGMAGSWPSGASESQGAYDTDDSRKAFETLTDRQKLILKLTARGHRSRDIALDLNIGKRTVETHKLRAMKKMKFKSRAELMRFAIQNDLL